MRTKKELYEVILASYIRLSKENPDSGELFICNHIELCVKEEVITKEEKSFIFEDFKANRPNKTQHKEFMKEELGYKTFGSCWWWLCTPVLKEGIEIRIEFLRKMVIINQ